MSYGVNQLLRDTVLQEQHLLLLTATLARRGWWYLQTGLTHRCCLMPCYSCKILRAGGLCTDTSVMAITQSLRFKTFRQGKQRGRREASYCLYHVTPPAAQWALHAAGDPALGWVPDFILEVSRDSKLAKCPKPHVTEISKHQTTSSAVQKVL